jgi:hypothetical protein
LARHGHACENRKKQKKQKAKIQTTTFHIRLQKKRKERNISFGAHPSRMSDSSKEFAEAILNGDSSSVELLILSGLVDVNARLPVRYVYEPPALVCAVGLQRRQEKIVEILLRANANS